MARRQLDEHRRYLADDKRAAAYRAALAEVVEPGDVVLDLGSGSGVLGYLACDAGAKSVIAVDQGDIVSLGRRIAADNGYADRITHIQALSVELELDAPVDVVVCDQIGGLVHDAGVLSCFADARQRLLAPGGRLVPAGFRVHLAPVTFDVGRQAIEFWASRPGGIDVGAARTLAVNTEWKYHVTGDDLVALATGEELTSFPSDHPGPIGGTVGFEIDRAGRLDGFIGWFEARMSPSVTMTNDPWSPGRFDRWCNFYATDEAVEVRGGDEVSVQLDVRPRLGVVAWTTDVARQGGARRRMRQSTLHGSLMTGATLDHHALGRAVPDSERLDLVRAVVDLIDGVRTEADIVGALGDRVGAGFASHAHLVKVVRDVVALARG
jgi:protein arginine N-methyltransferase 1